MFAFAKDATFINAVEDHIKIMGFVGKATIITKKLQPLCPRTRKAAQMGAVAETNLCGSLPQSSGCGLRSHLKFMCLSKIAI